MTRKRCGNITCNKVIPKDVHIGARTRKPIAERDPNGQDADYCSTTCRNTAAQRRKRHGEAMPRATYLKKATRNK
jgi:hypothetical protein